MTYLRFIPLFLVFALTSSLTSAADMWEKGRHYFELPTAIETSNPDKIEVLEVFWYGCGHCYDFNNNHLPGLESGLQNDTYFKLLPATFPQWTEHAKAYFASELLGVQKKMHQPLFDSIQSNAKRYKTAQDLKHVFIDQGVKSEEFDAVFVINNAKGMSKVDELIEKAHSKIQQLRISGVPALVINGKYIIGVRGAGGFPNMVKIANFLIDKER
jgi:thiol:disulfide interchange protein DsbA